MTFELVPLESDEQLKPDFAGKKVKSRSKVELASRLFSEGQVDMEGAAKMTGEHPVDLKHLFTEQGILPYKKISYAEARVLWVATLYIIF